MAACERRGRLRLHDGPLMGTVEDEGRPDWLPAKFENEEALAKSYRELEQRFTELAGEKRALEESLSSSDAGPYR